MLRRKIKEVKIGKWPLSIEFGNKYGGWQWGFEIKVWYFSFCVQAYGYGGRTFRIRVNPKHLYITVYIANGDGVVFNLECDRYGHTMRRMVKHLLRTDPGKLKEIQEIFKQILADD